MFRWSSCVADFCSSSDSSEEEYEFEDNEVDWESDVISQGFVEEIVRLNESEAFEKLKHNNWNCKTTALEILQDVTHDSLDHLSSQGDMVKGKKLKHLIRKLERLKGKFVRKSIVRREQEGTKLFISESQESFVELVKEEKDENDDDNETDCLETEEVENKQKQYRKPFNCLGTDMKRLRTDHIFQSIIKEAQMQQISTTQLLAYLLYRENYSENRKFALTMLKLSQGDPESHEVPTNKAIAIISRGRLGRTAYNYVRRMLKPHKESGQKIIL